VGTKLLGGNLGQANDGTLAGRIRGIGRASVPLAGNGSQVHDPATAAWNHLASHAL